jgi:uncharacterized protein involved in exopolysaccharide biosynthesis
MHLPSPENEFSPPARVESAMPFAYPQRLYRIDEENINLLDYWRVVKKRKWLILLIAFLSTALAFGVTRLMPQKYNAEATIMPITNSGSGGGLASAMGQQLSAIPLLGSQFGSLSQLGGGKSKELVNILKSRTLTEKIVVHNDLMKVIFAKRYNPATQTYTPNFFGDVPVLEDALKIFQKKISSVEEEKKTGLIKIQITLKDPELAAKIANGMILALQDFINTNAVTLSKRNRIFIEEQLVKNKAKLLEAGKDLNNFYAQNKISSVFPQLDVSAGSYQSLPRPFEDFQKELENLNQRQKSVENLKEEAVVRNVPGQVYLQYLTLNRELLGKTHALLTQQFELAKIEEAKEDLAFQVIDKAYPAVRPFSPKLLVNLLVGLISGIFVGLCLAFFLEYIHKLKEKEKAAVPPPY